MKRVKERITSQKKIILDYLKKTKFHPSAEEVYLNARKKLPRISKGTVYRILNNLKEKGEIQELPCETRHYDGCLSPHAHFFCERCGGIFDVFEKIKIGEIKKTKVGRVKKYQVLIYGICKKCEKNK